MCMMAPGRHFRLFCSWNGGFVAASFRLSNMEKKCKSCLRQPFVGNSLVYVTTGHSLHKAWGTPSLGCNLLATHSFAVPKSFPLRRSFSLTPLPSNCSVNSATESRSPFLSTGQPVWSVFISPRRCERPWSDCHNDKWNWCLSVKSLYFY